MLIAVFTSIAAVIIILGYLAYQNMGSSANMQVQENLQSPEKLADESKQTNNKMNENILESNTNYQAKLNTTAGEIVIDLHQDQTPITVSNFVKLSQENFYDNTIFHRVIEGFMIQGGDPKGDGTGGPGYRFDDEPFEGEYTRGTVAMANSGPNTNGSQFFIMHQDYPLPPNYVIFGKVSQGLEVVDEIATAEVSMSPGGEASKPVEPVTVLSVEIITEPKSDLQ